MTSVLFLNWETLRGRGPGSGEGLGERSSTLEKLQDLWALWDGKGRFEGAGREADAPEQQSGLGWDRRRL